MFLFSIFCSGSPTILISIFSLQDLHQCGVGVILYLPTCFLHSFMFMSPYRSFEPTTNQPATVVVVVVCHWYFPKYTLKRFIFIVDVCCCIVKQDFCVGLPYQHDVYILPGKRPKAVIKTYNRT